MPSVGSGPTVADILAQLDAINIPSAKVQRIDDVLADPQLQARGMFVEQKHPRYGTLRLPNLPFRFSDCETDIDLAAPGLGQHNVEVARELGSARTRSWPCRPMGCSMPYPRRQKVLSAVAMTDGIDRYAVIGRPIRHTVSPLVHGLFAEQTGQAMTYEVIEVAELVE